ncbi:3-isopropylmalate dehydratase small subunit [Pelolinea submarina]|uniref:3-isopropylmalate dehydratase small subunit n=1 Tax=Pelolinea submarina TaxID=913107 RepID=A0A347ZPH6_9CHLR|nr:3-isopropylmalate dehydratase small subunit [Pelolinea submarina]REG04779.1 3-isopropylmalate/(R)-2-methylmalate dehydratase small subunit [Pelolinea submarina]BBB47207.1 3-isopropylmalate/(R)-2-methylmalate dehydratase small subunit [Pelolinea submarina]
MQAFTQLNSRVVALPLDDIDTDQIIPARFLKITDKADLANHLFNDWRYNPDGSPRADFIINQPEANDAQILFAGDNFGCGSSREHAPWALVGFGFRVVIATSFGDIFRNNSLKNGLLPIKVSPQVHQQMREILEESPRAEWSVDLNEQSLTIPSGLKVNFDIDPFSKTCLLQGKDELGYLLSVMDQIVAYEKAHLKQVPA